MIFVVIFDLSDFGGWSGEIVNNGAYLKSFSSARKNSLGSFSTCSNDGSFVASLSWTRKWKRASPIQRNSVFEKEINFEVILRPTKPPGFSRSTWTILSRKTFCNVCNGSVIASI